MDFHIRAVEQDVHWPSILALDSSCFPSTGTMKAYQRQTNDIALVAVPVTATEDEPVFGFAIGYPITDMTGPYGYLAWLGVREENRNTGVGRALLKAAMTAMKDQGLTSVRLHVSERNKVARYLYTTLGFTVLHAHKNFYGKDEWGLLMAAVLS
jgi:ribosomal protein S18 acetylase RimI-like enzyme